MTSRAIAAWSEWRSLRWREVISPAVLGELLDGGQAFRWRLESDGCWHGRWAGHTARLKPGDGGSLLWSAPEPGAEAVGRALETYLDTGREGSALTDVLPWRGDPHLLRCLISGGMLLEVVARKLPPATEA